MGEQLTVGASHLTKTSRLKEMTVCNKNSEGESSHRVVALRAMSAEKFNAELPLVKDPDRNLGVRFLMHLWRSCGVIKNYDRSVP